MSRFLFPGVVLSAALTLALPVTLPIPALAENAAPVQAPAQGADAERAALAGELATALQMAEVFAVMRQEGVDYGKSLEDELFPGQGGDRWNAVVALIYDPAAMNREFEVALARELTGDSAPIREAIAFFASDRGKAILKLEVEARRALLDTAVEEAAKVRSEQLQAEDHPLVDRIMRFERAGDLIEMNVAGALNANLAFYRGMSSEDGFPDVMSDDDMLAEVWGQEADIRAETERWLFPYLAMAYEPLPEADLDAYIGFAESEGGRAMNAVVFAAFDKVFTRISADLGRAAARQMKGSDI